MITVCEIWNNYIQQILAQNNEFLLESVVHKKIKYFKRITKINNNDQ